MKLVWLQVSWDMCVCVRVRARAALYGVPIPLSSAQAEVVAMYPVDVHTHQGLWLCRLVEDA